MRHHFAPLDLVRIALFGPRPGVKSQGLSQCKQQPFNCETKNKRENVRAVAINSRLANHPSLPKEALVVRCSSTPIPAVTLLEHFYARRVFLRATKPKENRKKVHNLPHLNVHGPAMSDQSPMFNVPALKRHNPPILLLRIPSPASPAHTDHDSSITTISSNTTLVTAGISSTMPNIPKSHCGPRRKPPPIDFSKIDGSHSYTPDTNSPANPSPREKSEASEFTKALKVDTNVATQRRPLSQLRSLEHLSPEDWNNLANGDKIVELSKLGEGNGGSVSKCKLRSGSPVFALKLINVDSNPDVQKQIVRELQYNRLCSSSNIVKYYGTFLVGQQSMIGIAMEYMGGRSLDAIYKRVIEIDSTNRINEKVLGKIAESVLRGLSYLHQQRIIHRDIKPSNILLDKYGNVKLCDFGVSGEVVNSLATTFVGTQYYMAPERIMGKPYNVSCDVWSLGLTILEVAKGQFPYHLQADNTPLGPIELLSLILEYQPRLEDIPEEGIFWSESFKSFIDFCMKKNSDERPSPQQMLQHPWCVGQLQLRVDMEKFVKRLWGDNLE